MRLYDRRDREASSKISGSEVTLEQAPAVVNKKSELMLMGRATASV